MLVTGQTWTAEVPHEPGQTITFRKLSWRELELAVTTRRRALLEEFKGMAEVMARLPQSDAKQAPAEMYDTGVLLKAAIIAWTYPEEVTPENIDLLDDATAQWAVEQVRSSHTVRDEKAQKNG